MSEETLKTEIERQIYKAARTLVDGGSPDFLSQFETQVYNAMLAAGVGGGGGGGGGESAWDDPRATAVAWDRIPAGTSLLGKSWQDVIEMQVYPYLDPAFSAFAISTFSAQKEVGSPVSANGTATWTVSNAGNLKDNSISLVDHLGQTVFSGAQTSPQSLSYASWTKNSTGTTTWTLSGKSTKNATFTKTASISWLFKLFYGESPDANLDAAGVKALRVSTLASSKAGSYVYQAGGYKYLAVPQNLGKPTSFKDASNNLPIPMDDLGTMSITNSYNVTQTYYVFRTSNVLGGSVTIIVA